MIYNLFLDSFSYILNVQVIEFQDLLIDQTFVCGLGNIYVNEALYMSKIKPLRACNSLNKNEIKRQDTRTY